MSSQNSDKQQLEFLISQFAAFEQEYRKVWHEAYLRKNDEQLNNCVKELDQQRWNFYQQFEGLAERNFDLLIQALEQHGTTYGNAVAKCIQHVLCKIHPFEAVEPLITLLATTRRPLWDYVVHILAGIGTPDAVEALLNEVRVTGEDDSINFLDKQGNRIILQDELDNHITTQGSKWEILETTISGFGLDIIPFLVPALSDPDRRIRHFAVSALTWIGNRHGGEHVTQYLLPLLQDTDSVVRTATVYGLQILDDEQSIPALIAALEDSHADVRWLAAETLGGFTDERAIAALTRLADKPNEGPVVHAAAIEALNNIRNS